MQSFETILPVFKSLNNIHTRFIILSVVALPPEFFLKYSC